MAKGESNLLILGDCPVCGDTAQVVFLTGLGNARVFAYCPLCGIAWTDPERYFPDGAWHRPEEVSGGQARAATPDEIKAHGWERLVTGVAPESIISAAFYVR
jgi:hypothetical protein